MHAQNCVIGGALDFIGWVRYLAFSALTTVVLLLSSPLDAWAGATSTGYNGGLIAPLTSRGASTFVWQIDGAKSKVGREIGHIELFGCWRADQITAVRAIDRNGNEVAVSVHSGGPKAHTVETDDVNDSRLPLSISLTFEEKFGSAVSMSTLFVKTGGGRDEGVVINADGPTCEPPDDGETFEKASIGSLELVGVSEKNFVSVDSVVQFDLAGAMLSDDLMDIRAINNGIDIPKSKIQIDGNSILLNSALLQGRNRLVVLAADSNGESLSAEATLWAGSYTLNVLVFDENGQPANGAQVAALLGDDQAVGAHGFSVNGLATFHNVPNWTVILKATAEGNRFATTATHGAASSVTLRLLNFNQSSPITNNDFSQGMLGWDVGSAPAQIVSHTEAGGGTPQGLLSVNRASGNDVELFLAPPRNPLSADALSVQGGATVPFAESSNLDLRLTTFGIGAKSVSRTFTVLPGTSSVRARFRFVTSEIPGGFFGTQFNDYYSVSIRSQSGGAANVNSNSMNALGLGAFDAAGATGWYEVSLPVDVAGDTLQVDVVVSNVADGAYDSQVIIDFVAEEQLKISANMDVACPNQTITFQPEGSPTGSIAWSDGGQPATGSGNQFQTRFPTIGDHAVQATLTNGSSTQAASKTVKINAASGATWVARFPASVSTGDLVAPFGGNVDRFIASMRAGGAAVSVASTFRPPERAYLMHYAYRVATGLDAASVPAKAGVDICWLHRDSAGNPDVAASRAAAQAMVNAYSIVFAPALQSRHTQRRAIDMSILWSAKLTLNNAAGAPVVITTTPRTGAGNAALHTVGAGYGVIKLVRDRPHWSDDGR